MPIHAIAPSPVARLLLELEARSASGGVDIGGRRMVLTKGAIVEVRPASDDASLGDFLVAAGRLSEEDLATSKKQATEQRSALEVVLRTRELVPLDVLLETRRALWLDRFVRGLAAEERAGKQPSLLTPEPHPSAGPSIVTLPFVLDGLARRAGFGDAEQVGRHASAWFDWLDTPQHERASQWADFGEIKEPTQVSQMFSRHPAAPSRIAALVRAGLTRLTEERPSLPPPAPRNPVIAAPAPRTTLVSARPGSIAPPPLEASREQLEPGRARADERPIGITPVASWFPEARGTLDDPLDALERRIASLEQSGASPSERSRAWLDLARAFRTFHDSIVEAARASREAAAADPKSPEALEAAAVLCSAIGRPDLAYAYAVAWADAAVDPQQRGRVLVRASEYALRADKEASALRALRLACDALPDDPAVLERFARALASRGDAEGAVRTARLAAERYRKVRPEHARAVLSWATQIAPNDAELASDFASTLAADGHGEAAVAVIARAARKHPDQVLRTKLFLHAAVRAELSARPDVAGELLIEALDHAPDDPRPVYEPLLNDLAAAGATIELAVMAEEIAQRCRGAERAAWLTRAGEARLELPGDSTHALELFTQAVIADPSHARALDVIAQFADAERDPRLLTDAMERALSGERQPKQVVLALVDRFLAHVTSVHDAPVLERWAWAFAARHGGRGPSAAEQSQLEARLAKFETELRGLENELRTVTPERRADVAVRLAERLRDDPARRGKAKKLLEKVLEIEPANVLAQRQLGALLRLERDTRGLCALAIQRVTVASSSLERVGAELAWVHAELDTGNTQGAIEACKALLAHAPKNREAVFLLWRLSTRSKDPSLVRDALARRVDASLDPRERARACMGAAHAALASDDRIEAVRRADAALAADPRSADAALLLLEHHTDLEPVKQVAALKSARAVLGDTPELLGKLARACFGTRDAKGQLEALEAHLRASPFESFAALGLAALWSTSSDLEAITQAAERVLAPERVSAASMNAVLVAIERLWSLGHRTDALELVIEASNGSGELADDLLAWALPCVRELGEPRLEVAIMERVVARASGEERVAQLRKLAYFHREHGTRHAEARAYLRLLAAAPTDGEALERLAFIYAETREAERLTSVLTLHLDLAKDAEERRERLLTLALSALDVAGDASGAQELVASALVSERRGDEIVDAPLDAVRRGAGMLLGGSSPQSAFDLLLELFESSSRERGLALLEEAVYVAETYLDNPDLALRAATLGLESYPGHAAFLLHFERLALDLGDVATGREVYKHLSESAMGVHGRRALLYRAARWLERAGALSDALSSAEQAFTLAPSEGAVLQTLERIAKAAGQQAGLVRGLTLLADQTTRPARRSELLFRAGVICEDELRDPERALELYRLAYATQASAEVEKRALACAATLRDVDTKLAQAAYTAWRDMLSELERDAFATVTRARALAALGRLALEGFGSEADAVRYATQAQAAVDADEDLDDATRAAIGAELSALGARIPARHEPKAARVQKAVEPAKPDANEPAPTKPERVEPQAAELDSGAASAAVPAPAATSHTPSTKSRDTLPLDEATPAVANGSLTPARVSAIPYGASASTVESFARSRFAAGAGPVYRARTNTDPGIAPVGTPQSLSAATGFDPRTTQRGFSAPKIPVEAAREAAAAIEVGDRLDQRALAIVRGERAEVGALLGEVGTDGDKAERVAHAMLRLTRQHGPTLAGLECLAALGSQTGQRGLVRVCAEALAFAHPNASPVRAARAPDPSDASVKTALLEARDDGELSPAFTMLAHVYQGAGPIFRRSLTSYGVSAGDFISTKNDGAYARALRDAFDLFGVEHEAYLHHSGENRITIVATQPAAILIGDKTSDEARSLRYRLARAFERARPGSALLCTMSRDSTETLLSAVKAAFGPTDPKSPPVAREAAAMAAELWRTMPSSAQRQVSNIFRVLREAPAHAALDTQLALRSARVGLVAINALDVALASLDVDLATSVVPARNEDGLEAALRDQPVFKGLVTFALSDAYLAVRDALST